MFIEDRNNPNVHQPIMDKQNVVYPVDYYSAINRTEVGIHART